MINVPGLRSAMERQGRSSAELASALGLSAKAFEFKVETGALGLDEANKLVALLHISDPKFNFFLDE